MKSKRHLLGIGFVLAVSLLAVIVETGLPQKSPGTDYEALAQKLVNQCAGIGEDDMVLISGGVRDAELLEDLAVHVRKVGAFPLVRLESDRMTRRMYTDVPAKYDSQVPESDLKLFGMVTAVISVDYGEAQGLLADIPPERQAANGNAYQPVTELMMKRAIRQVNLGNELFPTSERAKLFGISQEDLAKMFWDGVNVDYSKLQATGERVKAAFAAGKEVHITNPNGTDLKMRIEGRQVLVSDGVISAADRQSGGAACQVWLPAGEVYLTPVPGTAEGKVVVERQLLWGKEIQGLTLTFKAGTLTSMIAKSGIEGLKALYDASGPGKETFAFIDVGINPNVRLTPGSRIDNYVPAGMITVGFGGNSWAGGENNASFGLGSYLAGSTLKVDGKAIVENGVLKEN